MKLKLIPEWRKGLKFWSVQLSLVALFISTFAEYVNYAWTFMPPSMSQHMPHADKIALTLFVIGLLARFLKQGDKSGEKQD